MPCTVAGAKPAQDSRPSDPAPTEVRSVLMKGQPLNNYIVTRLTVTLTLTLSLRVTRGQELAMALAGQVRSGQVRRNTPDLDGRRGLAILQGTQ